MARKILVTSALPYANAPLHLGYIMEAVQTDIWARFQKMRGNDCIYCCAEDAHGTPIMIRAQQEGITPETLIAFTAEEHRRDLAGFLIGIVRGRSGRNCVGFRHFSLKKPDQTQVVKRVRLRVFHVGRDLRENFGGFVRLFCAA